MLIELTIKNIALIESLRLEFAQGFNVLTGETGSGKSIVVDCMNLVLGGRADRDLVRTGTEKGMVQALFDISNSPNVKALADELGADCTDDLLVISRELNRNGRNICRICGVIVPLATLKQLTGMLLDIHGQHEHQGLMNPNGHIDFLDAFGDEQHHKLMRETSELYASRRLLASSIKKTMAELSEKERLTDMLTFQIREITSAKLKRGEEEKITSQMHILENAEKIRSNLESAYFLTYQGDGRIPSAQEALLEASHRVQSIASIDEAYASLAKRLKESYDIVRDIGYDLQELYEGIDANPAMLDKLTERLSLIDKLERKYGETVDDVISFGESAQEKLNAIQSGDENIAQDKKRLKQIDAQLRKNCVELTASRRALAEELAKRIMAELKDLGMAKTQFVIQIKEEAKPSAKGMDHVEFLISPNPGEPLKPMAMIASGGELSRIMLAFKAISMDVEGVESMVFDEIDTGVSGRMAQVVGEKMCAIAKNRQVLCVTHLPQIAALGNAQYLVEKQTDGEHTHTLVRLLDEEGRILELSRLVGAGIDNESSFLHAQSLLHSAEETRAKIQSK